MKNINAVVLVHGQGEQRPMQFGPEFVEHVLGGDFDPATASATSNPQIRWIPEEHEGLDDVRRIEVRYSDERPDLDIFELYWAPRMAGNQISHFQRWFFSLLRRPRKELPKRVRWVKPAIIGGVWLIFITMLFYLYLTAGALFPVQIVQIATHGFGDFFQFALDMRLAVFSVPFVLTCGALIALLMRNYGWALSFCLAAAIMCAAAPLVSDSRSEIYDDTYRLQGDDSKDPPVIGLSDPPPYNIWGAPLDEKGAHPSRMLRAAASISRALCGESIAVRDPNDAARGDSGDSMSSDEEADEGGPASHIKKARRKVDVYSQEQLNWPNMNPTAGGQLNDICLTPIALASPVVFARDADSGHVLATIILSFFGAMAYLVWRVFIRGFLVNIMGDSARYLNNHPDNIISRHDIRKFGVGMLERLHQTERYSRILVFAHSLGSVVTYDILRQYWGHVSNTGVTLGDRELNALREAARQLETDTTSPDALAAWRDAQQAGFQAVQAKWKISDFVTMGSPLAHGRLLLEGSPEKPHPSGRFESQRDVTRAMPACPPVDIVDAKTQLQSSDMFLVVRWTNLFFSDDLVGGRVAADADGPLFGPGVKDEQYSPKRMAARGISHNSYWMSRYSRSESGNVPWLNSLRGLLRD